MAQAARVDILIVGAGAAGLSAGIALARSGFSVAVTGTIDAVSNGRTVALFEGSLRFYRALGIWPQLAGAAAKIEAIEMIDATASPVPIPTLAFSAGEVGLEALGANIETDKLSMRLAEIARGLPNLRLETEWVADITYDSDSVRASFTSGHEISAKLIVAADGQRSTIRNKARIGTRRWSYPQVALTALVQHQKPHRDRSIEFHTRSGPCTLVPLVPGSEAPHRSSLVWLMSAQQAARRRALAAPDLAAEIEHEVKSIYGTMSLDSACGFFPMAGMRVSRLVGRRIALLGEAAHAFPPLAAQGLNLSLRDIATLSECLDHHRHDDIGGTEALHRYAKARGPDIALRTHGIDILNRSLLSDFLPVDLFRGAGFLALATIGPLRRALILEGILPASPRPRLKRPFSSGASRPAGAPFS